MEESKPSGGGSSTTASISASVPSCSSRPRRIASPGPASRSRIRRDAQWNVPEPELALVDQLRAARIVGYTIGNDMSSRDIEGENPLYLPQAKVYDGVLRARPGRADVSTEPLAARRPTIALEIAAAAQRGVRGQHHAGAA